MNIQSVQSRMNELQKILIQMKKRSATFSSIRFVLLSILVVCFYMGYQKEQNLNYVISACMLILFFYMVSIHTVLKDDIEYQEALIESYQDIVARKGKEWKQFIDDGNEFVKQEKTQALDLDLYGKASLYQYLCVAKTKEGRAILARSLDIHHKDEEYILNRQKAITECTTNTAFTLHMVSLSKLFQKHTKKKQKRKLEDFYSYMETQTVSYPKVFKYIFTFISINVWAMLGIAILHEKAFIIAFVCFMFSMCIALLCVMKNGSVLLPVAQSTEIMKDYEAILKAMNKQTFQSSYLLELQQRVENAIEGMRSLNRILEGVRFRNNFIMNFILNGLFLIDFQCVFALENWKRKYGKHVREWLVAIGEMESVLSFAQLGIAKDTWCVPTILKQDTPSYDLQDMYHPLLDESQVIKNSFQAEAASYIITGSNMSGKTTFLRTIGVNIVLLNAGAAVCASTCCATSMDIYTSMRVHDNVSEGISTFYAEILRIKDMMQASNHKVPILILIDEIFKGTNSADRIMCAKQAIIRLHLPWVITMVSTHDFELCDLEKDKDIKASNYHFSEYYEDDKICFDYTLKDGRCTTTNAKQLMKLAGL